METQLTLIDEQVREWRIDEDTRRAGRRGIEQARDALRDAFLRDASRRAAA